MIYLLLFVYGVVVNGVCIAILAGSNKYMFDAHARYRNLEETLLYWKRRAELKDEIIGIIAKSHPDVMAVIEQRERDFARQLVFLRENGKDEATDRHTDLDSSCGV